MNIVNKAGVTPVARRLGFRRSPRGRPLQQGRGGYSPQARGRSELGRPCQAQKQVSAGVTECEHPETADADDGVRIDRAGRDHFGTCRRPSPAPAFAGRYGIRSGAHSRSSACDHVLRGVPQPAAENRQPGLDNLDADHIGQLGGHMGKGCREAPKPFDAAAVRAPARQRDLRPRGHVARERAGSCRRRPCESGSDAELSAQPHQYANAVRDLLGVEIDPKAMLPPTNRRSDSTTTPARFRCNQRCWTAIYAAAKIARLVVGDPTIGGVRALHRAERQLERVHVAVAEREARRGDPARVAQRGVAAAPFFPVDGEYVFKIRLGPRPTPASIRGLRARTTSKFASTASAPLG